MATLKQIAQEAGCSVGVASVVLNQSQGNIGVSAAMRRRVERAAEKLGYAGNFAASALKRQSTRTLGLYVAPRPGGGLGAGSFEDRMLHGIEQACVANEYDLLIVNMSVERDPEVCVRLIRQGRVDGIIVMDPGRNLRTKYPMAELSGRVVFLGAGMPASVAPRFAFDNHAAMALTVAHLRALGHRRIAFVGQLHDPLADCLEREQGFRSAIEQTGLPANPEWVLDHGDLLQPGFSDVMRAPAESRPTALVALNDSAAAIACRELRKLGLHVPERISVIGVDDSTICEFTSPTLTSIRHPLEDMGRDATEHLIAGLGKAADARAVKGRFPPVLVERESTGPAPDEKTTE